MVYKLVLSARAKADIREAFDYIHGDSPVSAASWLQKLEESFQSLMVDPVIFDLIPEARTLGNSFRSFNHYSHRVIYFVDQERATVRIYRLYHGARRPLTKREIPIR